MKLFRSLFRFYLMPLGEEGGGGASPEPAATPAAPEPIAAAPAEPIAPVVAATPAAPAVPEKPETMFDAISRGLAETNGNGQPRDQVTGRWAPKTDANGTVIPGQVQPPNTTLAPVAPVVPVPAEPADPLAMPEGLGAKAQERFQKLANTVKETTAERDEARAQTEYIRTTFQASGIKQDQFEQAVALISMVNKGDLIGAQRMLQTQLQQIALQTGQPIGQVDALAGFPDLRDAVNGLQITEQHAMELARGRQQQATQQRVQQQTEQSQQSQAQAKQAHDTGLAQVDALCKQFASTDMDWPVVEAQLLPVIKDLLDGVPPNMWAAKVRAQVGLIKSTAQKFRPPPPVGSNALRPTGQASPSQAPKSTYEAMWGVARA